MHILHTTALIALLVVSSVHSKSVSFRNCPDSNNSRIKVEIEPCTSEPCQIHRGESVSFKVTFQALSSATSIQSKLYGYSAGMKIPFQLDNPDACTNYGLECPLTAGTGYTFRKSISPHFSMVAEWQLVDSDSGNKLFCFQVPINMV